MPRSNAPGLATVGMKSKAIQASSAIHWSAGIPQIRALKASAYCVAEWLPQIVTFVTSATGLRAFAASCARARLWSSRVRAVNLEAGIPSACREAISAFVFAGFPVTTTRTSGAAEAARARPCAAKMAALASSRSARSMPALRGDAPTSIATFAPSKATAGSSVTSMPFSCGKAQSSSSIATPSRAFTAAGTSSSRNSTGSSPSRSPEASR